VDCTIVLSCFTIVVLWFSTTSMSTLVFLYYSFFKVLYSFSSTLRYLHQFFTCAPVLFLPTPLLLLACNSSTCALVLSSTYTTTCTCTHYIANLYSLFLSYHSTPLVFRCLGPVFLFLQYYLRFSLYCLHFSVLQGSGFTLCNIICK
jgi:hypothetical protein